MYIPTQEERYAKKGLLSLILCVVVPSCLYLSLLSEQLNMVRGHEWEAIMKSSWRSPILWPPSSP